LEDAVTVKVLDCFAGIGGFTLGLERAGFETVAFCEIEPYCQKVLAKHWPEVPIYDDIREITADRLIRDGIRPDVITGGFPCQDISTAGKQAGIDGERSGLWGELARLIGEVQPRYAIMENVTNLISGDSGRWFGRVLGDLAQVGYDAEWHCIPASAIGAHHHRDRVWIVAYPNSDSESVCTQYARAIQEAALLADTDIERSQGRTEKQILRERHIQGQLKRSREDKAAIWATEPRMGRVANGVPARSHRLKCLGNAVVPPIPELIGRAIINYET